MIMLEPSEGGEICGGGKTRFAPLPRIAPLHVSVGIIDLFKKINIKKNTR